MTRAAEQGAGQADGGGAEAVLEQVHQLALELRAAARAALLAHLGEPDLAQGTSPV